MRWLDANVKEVIKNVPLIVIKENVAKIYEVFECASIQLTTVEMASKRKRRCYPSKSVIDDITAGKSDAFLDFLSGYPREDHYLQQVPKFIYPLDLKLIRKSCLWLHPKGPKIDSDCNIFCDLNLGYITFLKSLLIPKSVDNYSRLCPALLKALKKFATTEEEKSDLETKAFQSFQQLCHHQPDLIFVFLILSSCAHAIKDVQLEGTYKDDFYSTVIKISLLGNHHLCEKCIKSMNETDAEIVINCESEITLSQSNRDVHFPLEL